MIRKVVSIKTVLMSIVLIWVLCGASQKHTKHEEYDGVGSHASHSTPTPSEALTSEVIGFVQRRSSGFLLAEPSHRASEELNALPVTARPLADGV